MADQGITRQLCYEGKGEEGRGYPRREASVRGMHMQGSKGCNNVARVRGMQGSKEGGVCRVTKRVTQG